MNKTNELRAILTAAILAMTGEERRALLALVEGREKTGKAAKSAGVSPGHRD